MNEVVDLNLLPLPALLQALVPRSALERLLALARDEDLGDRGDITTQSIIGEETRAQGNIIARRDGVFCGGVLGHPISSVFDAFIEHEWFVQDGEPCAPGRTIARLHGSLSDLLRVERTFLNALCRLSGIASLTRSYVEAVRGTPAVICDTRKTTPGWRGLEKYAVRCGGGTLHRLGLYDAALYKDNHLASISPRRLTEKLTEATERIRATGRIRFVEVEADSLATLERVLTVREGLIDIVLLDNMSIEDLRAAVARRDERSPGVLLEASGGITLDTLGAIAETGVDRISVGALTHSAPALDIGLDIGECGGNG